MSKKVKIALVTGASRGIGAAIAERLGKEGYFVWINYFGDEKGAKKTLKKIQSRGGNGEIIRGDVGNHEEIEALFKQISQKSPRLDLLVNNAGICPFIEWEKVTEQDWDRTHAVNLKGAFFCTQKAAQWMVKSKTKGRIIAISSISALKGGTIQSHYCPTKGGMISMMNAFAVILGKYGITCNSVLPGTILTPINQEYLSKSENRTPLEQATCVGYIGMPSDVAGIVAFLGRDEARYITGASILVDGGEMVKHL